MPTQVNPQEGDCLCTIAIGAGFLNCAPLRAVGANSALLNRPLLVTDVVTIPDLDPGGSENATDQRHVFVRQNAPPVSIRLVHGSPNIPYLQDVETAILHISNHQTTRGGAEDDTTFPNGFGFNQAGHADPDAFKVEVVDPRAASPLTTVRLQALRRIVRPDGTFGHDVFPGGEQARRSLPGSGGENLDCNIVSSGVAFRSRYLRLVTDETDKAALPNQTLLVTDMTDQGDGRVEILEQAVRATYRLQNCPAGLCEVSKTIPVGLTDAQRPSRITGSTGSAAETKPRNFFNIAVHILNATAGGAPVVSIPEAERRVNRWVRRMWAQAGLAPRMVRPTRIVDPQNNLVAIGDPDGLTATGGAQMSFRISAPGHPSQNVSIVTVAGNTPEATANAIRQRVQAPFAATVTVNPAGFTGLVGNRSADILITAADGALVTIDQESLISDPRQTLAIGRPDPRLLPGFPNDFLIGSIEQRTILKNYDTGEDRIDVFVIQRFTDPDPTSLGDRGQAMMHGVSLTADVRRQAIGPVRFSVFITQRATNAGDANPASLPHEMGHVLMDVIHAVTGRFRQELMGDGGTSPAIAENATKRIKERLKNFDGRNAGAKRQLELVHQRGGGLLSGF